MSTGKGFIAALDQSGGSTPKALRLYGIPEDSYSGDDQMFDLVHEMRTRIITSPAFTSEHILGAILFEKTMDRQIEGMYSADFLWEKKGILPILKVDKGLAEKKDGVQIMKPIPEFDKLMERRRNATSSPPRCASVVHDANPAGIAENAQQFEIGKKIIAAGFVPILEPEVNIKSESKADCEVILKEEMKKHLAQIRGPDDKLMFSWSSPSVDGFYSDIIADKHVVRCVALSGRLSP